MTTYLQVSDIIPFLNAEKILDEVIQSGLPQMYNSWEQPLVDDGSADATTRHYTVRDWSEVYRVGQPCHKNRELTELSID